jgi:hypothetical protein
VLLSEFRSRRDEMPSDYYYLAELPTVAITVNNGASIKNMTEKELQQRCTTSG